LEDEGRAIERRSIASVHWRKQDTSWTNQHQCFGAQYVTRHETKLAAGLICPCRLAWPVCDHHHGFGWDKYGNDIFLRSFV